MQFIHAADAHIDSPLRGLETYAGAPADAMRQATREAFARLVSCAIDREVDFVILAGDLFDGQWPDMQTGIWTATQFRRLDAEGIPVYLLRGNHDAVSEVGQVIQWPDNVFEFPTDAPQTLIVENTGVALHGQGFARRDVQEDLASGYPAACSGMFNIGVLHTSLGGDPEHDTYAPTTLDVLRSLGYDYWALGHIHQRSAEPLCEHPYVAYSGNLQGRHAKETGVKGCLLVQVESKRIEQVEFIPTDVLRWHRIVIDVAPDDHVPEIHQRVRAALSDCRDQSDSRFCAIRLTVQGACRGHTELAEAAQREVAIAQMRDSANAMQDIWLEKIHLHTSPLRNLRLLREGNDLLAELLRGVEELRAETPRWNAITENVRNLATRCGRELQDAGLDVQDPVALTGWLHEAEMLLATHLAEPLE